MVGTSYNQYHKFRKLKIEMSVWGDREDKRPPVGV